MSDFEEILTNIEHKLDIRKNEIENLRVELNKKNELINSLPQLSSTSLGKSTSDGKIIYRNWWKTTGSEFNGFCDQQWFTKFIQHKFPDADYKLNFFGIFGIHNNINQLMDGKKILFNTVDISTFCPNFLKSFGFYALDYIDFAMGHDLINNPKYLRFPYWITANFSYDATEEDFEKFIIKYNSLNYYKTKEVVELSSHDNWNTRSLICDDIEQIVKIDHAGLWRKNTSELSSSFNNNIFEYFKQFKFNICAEDAIADGYVTTNIFNSIKAQCIPLYVGGGSYLEPEVINNEAIITWDSNKNNLDSIELFENILHDKKTYDDFLEQDVLLKSSFKFLRNKFAELEKCFEHLIYE